ncbi:MAG: SIMPL domain-containing protein [Chloroflexia bacterium]
MRNTMCSRTLKKLPFLLLLLLVPVLPACTPSTPVVSAGGGGEGLAYASIPANTTYTPGLTVVGTGTEEADPELAYVTVGVDLKGDQPQSVVNEASARMDAILKAVQAAGVEEKDIRTVGYNLWVEQRYDPQTGQPTGVVEYHIVHTVRLTVRDLGKVGALLAAVVEAGANTVNEVTYSVADPEALVARARQKAIADAQKKAEEMAAALDLSLGKVLSVSESGGWVPGPVYKAAGGGYEAAAVPLVPLPAGTFSVSVSVVVVYELP